MYGLYGLYGLLDCFNSDINMSAWHWHGGSIGCRPLSHPDKSPTCKCHSGSASSWMITGDHRSSGKWLQVPSPSQDHHVTQGRPHSKTQEISELFFKQSSLIFESPYSSLPKGHQLQCSSGSGEFTNHSVQSFFKGVPANAEHTLATWAFWSKADL